MWGLGLPNPPGPPYTCAGSRSRWCEIWGFESEGTVNCGNYTPHLDLVVEWEQSSGTTQEVRHSAGRKEEEEKNCGERGLYISADALSESRAGRQLPRLLRTGIHHNIHNTKIQRLPSLKCKHDKIHDQSQNRMVFTRMMRTNAKISRLVRCVKTAMNH
jgi:hypothetical protein